MKASLLFVMAASMIFGTVSVAQTNPRTPPHPPAPTTQSVPVQQRFNLNGIWKSSTPSGPAILRFQTDGDTVLAYLTGPGSKPTNVVGFQGSYAGNRTVSGKTLLSLQPAQWQQMTLIIDDPDHMHFAGHPEILRVSAPTAHDAVCDTTNSSHTQGDYAAMRTADAHRNKDYVLAACWSRIGAIQNDPRAEGYYAWLLETGKAGSKDYEQALSWAKKAADQHLEAAALLLQHMYAAGEGMPPDLKTAQYWHDQAWLFHGEAKWTAAMADPELRQKVDQFARGLTNEIADGMKDSIVSLSQPAPLPDAGDMKYQGQGGVSLFTRDCNDAGGRVESESLGVLTTANCVR